MYHFLYVFKYIWSCLAYQHLIIFSNLLCCPRFLFFLLKVLRKNHFSQFGLWYCESQLSGGCKQRIAFFFLRRLNPFQLHPWNLTWNLKRSPWKRWFLLETIISGSMLNFGGVGFFSNRYMSWEFKVYLVAHSTHAIRVWSIYLHEWLIFFLVKNAVSCCGKRTESCKLRYLTRFVSVSPTHEKLRCKAFGLWDGTRLSLSEQWTKTVCSGYIGDEFIPSYVGIS